MRRLNSEADMTKKIQKKRITYEPCQVEPPTEGIPFEKVVTPGLLSGFTCIVCKNLVWDPVELDDCHHVFCKFCINEWLKTHSTCPACRLIPKSYILPISLIRAIGELKIKCSNNGCPCTPCYSNYVIHLEKCEYRKYKCTNEKCNYIGLKKNVKSHCLICQFRLEECKYCQQLVPFCEHEEHANTVCQQEVKCEKCFVTMKRGEYFSKHYSENNENIQCLKTQVHLYKKELNKLNSKYEENTRKRENEEKKKEDSLNEQIKILEKNLVKIKKERSNLYSENESLKKKLKTIEDTLKNLSNLIKKEDKLNIIKEDDQEEEIKYNNTIEVDKAINQKLNINNKRKNYQNMRNKNCVSCDGHLIITARSSFLNHSFK